MTKKSSYFFRIILPYNLEKKTLELPRSFVKENEKCLSKDVRLKLPTGAVSKVKLRRSDGRAWLDKGWQNFVDKYSIKCGYFLIFKYKGKSCFSVQIFDLSTREIEYPVSTVIKVKEEDSVEILDERPRKVHKSMEMEITNQSLIEGKRHVSTIARENVLKRANAFRSPNPHFTITMYPTYIDKCSLNIPRPATSYFRKEGKKIVNLKLNEADERTWSIKYSIGSPPRVKVYFCSGWKKFLLENHLQEGDICVFELINSMNMVFKVTIFRISDNLDKNKPLVMNSVASPRGKKDKDSKALQAAKMFECYEPSFTVQMRRSYLNKQYRLDIPIAHGLKYLKNQYGKEAILHRDDGETWAVKCYVRGSKVKFTSGWKDFVVDNNLKQGDACVFELYPQTPNHYNVTIFRVEEA